ncbi:type II toxin-antitoxin system RelE family toxin [Halorussus amylolyticus]|uniref:type II toxin-antitoxin system RelE family toxin n=1 Tax=Halorussus amylolyticus TaxID=1126242 RepID=UPI0010483267|nr:hypothetical protein [Halorussus amylolyticus]
MTQPAVYLPPVFSENVCDLDKNHQRQIKSKIEEIAGRTVSDIETHAPRSKLYKRLTGRKYTWTARAGTWRLFCTYFEHVYDGDEHIPVIVFLNVQYREKDYQRIDSSVVPKVEVTNVLEWANEKSDREIRTHRDDEMAEHIDESFDV